MGPFRGQHFGNRALFVRPGPTPSEYSHEPRSPPAELLIVGFNGRIFTDFVAQHGLDYFFLQDTGRENQAKSANAFHKRVQEYTSFRPRLRTFCRTFRIRVIGPTVNESAAADGLRYESEYPACDELVPLVKDVGKYVFGDSCSVVMSALQFIGEVRSRELVT